MSKGIMRRSSVIDRFSDDDGNQRKQQLIILRNILLNQRNVNKLLPKNPTVRNGKIPKSRPTSAKSLISSTGNPLVKSITEEVKANEPARVSRSTRKESSDRQIARSESRPTTYVSFMSDKPNPDPSSGQFKKLLVRLSSELNNLESITGFKTNKNDLSSYSSSTALATALLGLVGHIKQCGLHAKEISNLKDQLSIVIQTQLDFQQRMENQITTLQTMMQTICQVVNIEMTSNRRCQSDQNWLDNAQRPYLIEKDTSNAMDELLIFTRRMNNGSPIDAHRHIETLEASKKITRPTSISPVEISPASPTETILEKILQERLRLVQQMNELNKQHEMTQEELANLEAKTAQISN